MPTLQSIRAVERTSISLSGGWQFVVDPNGRGEAEGWTNPGFDTSAWETVRVPHTWSVMPDYADYEGLAWYQHTFIVPDVARDAHLRLHFEAVFYLAKVWLNGEYLGEHEGGYTPFEFDVTGSARPGEENTLTVQVDNLRAPNRIPALLSETWSYDCGIRAVLCRMYRWKSPAEVYIARQQIVAVPNRTGWNEADSRRSRPR
jgi:beta-galactosidase/beta-glucuronidase